MWHIGSTSKTKRIHITAYNGHTLLDCEVAVDKIEHLKKTIKEFQITQKLCSIELEDIEACLHYLPTKILQDSIITIS